MFFWEKSASKPKNTSTIAKTAPLGGRQWHCWWPGSQEVKIDGIDWIYPPWPGCQSPPESYICSRESIYIYKASFATSTGWVVDPRSISEVQGLNMQIKKRSHIMAIFNSQHLHDMYRTPKSYQKDFVFHTHFNDEGKPIQTNMGMGEFANTWKHVFWNQEICHRVFTTVFTQM